MPHESGCGSKQGKMGRTGAPSPAPKSTAGRTGAVNASTPGPVNDLSDDDAFWARVEAAFAALEDLHRMHRKRRPPPDAPPAGEKGAS